MAKDKKPFLKPIFKGPRFEDHSLPLEVLPELHTYESFVVAVAKRIFLKKNPKRKRVPKEFVKRFQLSLKQIHEGSALAELVRAPQAPTLFDDQDEFDQARDLISSAIEAAGKGEPLPADFPPDLLSQFARLGQHLEEGESVELRKPDQDAGPNYDNEVRKRLLLMKSTTYPKEVSILATIFEVDTKKRTFQVEEIDGAKRKVVCSIPDDLLDAVLAAHKEHESVFLRVGGVGIFTPDDSLESIARVEELEVYDVPDQNELAAIDERLKELSTLEDGWLDGEGTTIPKDKLQFCGKFLRRLVIERGVPAPYLYPTAEKGLQAEWEHERWEVSAEFDFTEGTIVLAAVNLETGEDQETTTKLDNEDLEADVADFVLQLIPAQ